MEKMSFDERRETAWCEIFEQSREEFFTDRAYMSEERSLATVDEDYKLFLEAMENYRESWEDEYEDDGEDD